MIFNKKQDMCFICTFENNILPIIKESNKYHFFIRGFALGFANYKKCALDSQPQVIKFTRCLPMVGGSLRVLRLLPLKRVVMI